MKTNYQKWVLNRIKIFGERMGFFKCSSEVLKNDCLTIESAQQVIDTALKYGQIGGIFHLGLVLEDILIEKMNYEQFKQTVDCKFRVFNYMDKLTRKLNYELDYFVIFSSLACGIGNRGQTNYGYGNSMCEHICEQRRRDGLHGLAIQYGPIGDVGLFENISQTVEISSVQKQRINSCCAVLDKLLAVDQPVITSWVSILSDTDGPSPSLLNS